MGQARRPRLNLARPWSGETYYGLPPLKPAPWKWMVSGYVYLAGLAGAAQVLAGIAQHLDPRRWRGMVRHARYLSAVGTAAGAVLLIADLRTPRRWYNMLRILRPTSPMSVGSYILSAFGAFSGITALGEMLRGRGRAGRLAEGAANLAQVPAAIAGAGAATYTASILAATSSPLWAAAPRHLGALFATSATAMAAAALSLGERWAGRRENSRRLDDVAAVATAAHLGVSFALQRRWRNAGVSRPIHGTPSKRLLVTGDVVLAGVVPLSAYAINRLGGNRMPAASVVGSLALIAGGYALRHGLMRAGMESAKRPASYFASAQPEHLPRRYRHRVGDGR